MTQERVEAAQAWLRDHEQDLIDNLRHLLRIPSLEAPALPNAPFGQPNRDALDFMLNLSTDSGMTAVDMDGYCGYADFGQGKPLVMSLGHLDVVPVGPGWKHEPFGAEVDEGYIYARGASDDKGPTMAMFFACLAIKETWPDINVRVRNVFGCNEESGFLCVKHYVENAEAPTLGVAPDAGWPLIHAEKGIADFVIERPIFTGAVRLVEINGGQRPNIVIDTCRARVEVDASARAHMEMKVSENWDRNLTCQWEGDTLILEAIGKAAHGSIPFAGDSAAIRVARFLKDSVPFDQEDEYVEFFKRMHIGGLGLGISGSDEPSGPLTCNLGIVETGGNVIRLTLNCRYPVTWNGDEMRAKCEAHLAKSKFGYVLASMSDSKPLYFPLEHPIVKIICDAHQVETGEDIAPGVMGGGTYARAVPNTVAIGTGWAGDGPAHETDERIRIEHVHKMSRIYARIMVGLIEEAAKGQG